MNTRPRTPVIPVSQILMRCKSASLVHMLVAYPTGRALITRYLRTRYPQELYADALELIALTMKDYETVMETNLRMEHMVGQRALDYTNCVKYVLKVVEAQWSDEFLFKNKDDVLEMKDKVCTRLTAQGMEEMLVCQYNEDSRLLMECKQQRANDLFVLLNNLHRKRAMNTRSRTPVIPVSDILLRCKSASLVHMLVAYPTGRALITRFLRTRYPEELFANALELISLTMKDYETIMETNLRMEHMAGQRALDYTSSVKYVLKVIEAQWSDEFLFKNKDDVLEMKDKVCTRLTAQGMEEMLVCQYNEDSRLLMECKQQRANDLFVLLNNLHRKG